MQSISAGQWRSDTEKRKQPIICMLLSQLPWWDKSLIFLGCGSNTHFCIILPKERGSLGIYVLTPENNWVQADPGGCQFSSTSSLSQVHKRFCLMHFWKRTFQQAAGSWQKSTNMIRSKENGWENDTVCYQQNKQTNKRKTL